MRLTARLFGIAFLVIGALFFLTRPSYAQTISSLPQSIDANVPLTMHTYTQSVVFEALSSVICLLDGQDIIDTSHPCLGINPATKKLGYVANNHGLIGAITDMTLALYTPPLHTTDYLSYVSHNFGLAKQSYAADTCIGGVGFCGISPLIGIWTTFRNIVYLFFVVIFILVGFGIMLRMKIDPRTVMSIENQIPKLIIALVLVTFSFAIAGLMIDTMWVGSFIVTDILVSAEKPHTTDTQFNNQYVYNNFFQNPLGFSNNILPNGIIGVSAGSGGSVGDVVRGMFTPDNSNKLGLTPELPSQDCENGALLVGFFGTAFCNLGDKVGDVVAGALGYVLSWIVSALAMLIILVALLVSMFRVWFSLLLSYAYILIDVILAPFMIVFGVFPGSKIGFGTWARDIMANLMAFPTAIAMFLIGRLLMDAFTTNGGTSSLFVPPLIGNPNGTAGNGNPLGFLLGLAIVLMTPQVVNMMKALFKAPDNKFASAIFQGIGVGQKTVMGTGKQILGTVAGQEIKYGPDGKIEPVNNPLEKMWMGVVKKARG